eukprot:13715794-Alexandrium_andersonii.AAC.1
MRILRLLKLLRIGRLQAFVDLATEVKTATGKWSMLLHVLVLIVVPISLYSVALIEILPSDLPSNKGPLVAEESCM